MRTVTLSTRWFRGARRLAVSVFMCAIAAASLSTHSSAGDDAERLWELMRFAAGDRTESSSPAADITAEFAELWNRARQGEPEAQYRLALLYLHGKGVPQSIPAALQWLREAADKGHPAARLRLMSPWGESAVRGSRPPARPPR